MEYQRHIRNAQIERAQKILKTKNVEDIKKGPTMSQDLSSEHLQGKVVNRPRTTTQSIRVLLIKKKSTMDTMPWPQI